MPADKSPVAPAPPPPDEADDDESSRARDPEILAMERVWRMLLKLDPDARERVVAYLAKRSEILSAI